MTSFLTPEILADIDRAVADAPPFTPEQKRRLRAVWAPNNEARRVRPAGFSTPKGS